QKKVICPDCGDSVGTAPTIEPDRREFIKTVTTAAAGVATGGLTLFAPPRAEAKPTPQSAAAAARKGPFQTLSDTQKKEGCFDWDYKDSRGILRTHVSNNWQITKPHISSNFFTKDQQALIFDVYKGIFNPDWHERLMKQLKDDTGGRPWGSDQAIA